MHHFGSGIWSQMRFTAAGHFVSDGAGDDHAVGLTRGKPHDLGAKAGNIKPARAGGHQFDGAAGQAHRHRPDGVFAEPVQGGVHAGDDDVALDLRIVADFSLRLHMLTRLKKRRKKLICAVKSRAS